MQNYDLDKVNEAESFPFVLDGHTYNFRYPTTEEVTELTKHKLANGSQDVEAIMKAVYAFITPANDGAPSIEEAMGKARIQKFLAFQRMMMSELGLQPQGA